MLPLEPTSLRRLRALLYTCMVCAFLALGGLSCGQRGPLYLPDSKPTAASPAAANSQANEPQPEQAEPDVEAATPGQDQEYDEETP